MFTIIDWMEDTYYSPINKQEILEKEERDIEFEKLFPKEVLEEEQRVAEFQTIYFKKLNLDSSNQEIKNDNQ